MSNTVITGVDGRIIGVVHQRGRRRQRLCGCGVEAEFLCDFPLRGAKAGMTCSALLCSSCASVVRVTTMGPIHYCAAHIRAYDGGASDATSHEIDQPSRIKTTTKTTKTLLD